MRRQPANGVALGRGRGRARRAAGECDLRLRRISPVSCRARGRQKCAWGSSQLTHLHTHTTHTQGYLLVLGTSSETLTVLLAMAESREESHTRSITPIRNINAGTSRTGHLAQVTLPLVCVGSILNM